MISVVLLLLLMSALLVLITALFARRWLRPVLVGLGVVGLGVSWYSLFRLVNIMVQEFLPLLGRTSGTTASGWEHAVRTAFALPPEPLLPGAIVVGVSSVFFLQRLRQPHDRLRVIWLFGATNCLFILGITFPLAILAGLYALLRTQLGGAADAGLFALPLLVFGGYMAGLLALQRLCPVRQ